MGRLIAVGPLTAVLAIACALATANSDHPGPVTSSTTGQGGDPALRPAVSRPSVAQRNVFQLFRSRPEGVPPSLRQVIGRPIYGVNWSLGQAVRSFPSVRVWAVPGNGFVCLFGRQGTDAASATCKTTKEATGQGIALTLITAPVKMTGPRAVRRSIIGIAPIGVTEVLAISPSVIAHVKVQRGSFIHRDYVDEPPDRFQLLREQS